MESLISICFGISILFVVASNLDQYKKIEVNNKIIANQQQTIDSLKVELTRRDSTLVAWDVEYQQNLEESNNLVKELNK